MKFFSDPPRLDEPQHERYKLNHSNVPSDIRVHYYQMATEYVLIEIAAQLARIGNLLEERLNLEKQR